MDFKKCYIICICIIPILGLLKHIPICDTRRNLTPDQVEICKEYPNHVSRIIDAKFMSNFECKKQFEGRRWNCTLPLKALLTLFLPRVSLSTKENAYIHASTAGALMHTVSRACMEGKLPQNCACSEEGQPEVFPKTHIWGGCGDNLRYGYKFSKLFTYAGEKVDGESLSSFSKVLANLHNNEAGRWAVHEKSFIKCRCHGVSMNCATKTCHRQLGRFTKVAKHLETLHRSAIQVKLQQTSDDDTKKNEMKLIESDPEYSRYSAKDLVYIQDSPSYCKKDESIGSYGVSGRPCTKTNKNAMTDCNIMCCDKGYYSRRELVKTKCGCKFVWCCEVKCKTCETEQNNHYCR